MSRRNRRLRRPTTYKTTDLNKTHERLATDLPLNAEVMVAEVENPLAHVEDEDKKITVVRSLKHDPLASMYARAQIETHQFEAGRMWEACHEAAQVGTVSAIDPAKEAVDGGQIYQPIGDRQIKAQRKLHEAAVALGSFDAALVSEVLGERRQLAMLSPVETERKYLGKRFRDALETLAGLWGFSNKQQKIA